MDIKINNPNFVVQASWMPLIELTDELQAFTLNARESNEVISLARANQVYLHEAMWLRHRPLVLQLQQLLHKDKVIGDIIRVCKFVLAGLSYTAMP